MYLDLATRRLAETIKSKESHMFIWAWIFAVPFVAAVIDLAVTARRSSNVRYGASGNGRLVPRTTG